MNKRNLRIGMILALFFMSLGLSTQAQDGYIFFESFDGSSAIENPDYAFPSAWQTLDEDGLPAAAGNAYQMGTWTEINFTNVTGGPYIMSTSWLEDLEANADDWLITPEIEIGEGYTLEWKVGTLDATYPDGSIIYVSTSGNSPEDFLDGDIIYESAGEDVLSADGDNFALNQKSVSLEDYAGENIYIAFRNNTLSADGFAILLDDIGVLPPPEGLDAQLRAPEIPITYGWMPIFQATPIGPFGANVLGFNGAGLELENVTVTAYIDEVDDDGNFIPVWSAESDPANVGEFEETFLEINETWIPTVPATYALRYELTHDEIGDDTNPDNNFSQNYFFQITDLDYSRNAQFLDGDPPFIAEYDAFFNTSDLDENNMITDVTPTGGRGHTLEFVSYSRVDSFGVYLLDATGTITLDVREYDPVTNEIGEVLGTTEPFTAGTSGSEYVIIQMETPLDLAPGHYFMNINDPDDGSATILLVSHYWSPNCCWLKNGDDPWQQTGFVPAIETYLTELEGAATSVNYNITQDAGFTYDFQGIANGFVDSWVWDFGDGNTSTNQNVTHTYAEAGEYEVTVTITVDGEEITSDPFTINLSCALEAETVEVNPTNVTIEASEGSEPYTYVLLDANGDEIDSNETGVFGEDTPLDLETDYTVNVTDADGCTTEAIDFTTGGCTFSISDPNVSGPIVSFLDSETTGDPAVYNWPAEFNANTSNAIVTNAPDGGPWTMTIEDEFGCTDEVTFSVFPVGVEDIDVLNNIQIAPNPVNDAFVLDIDLKEATDLNYGIYDISGKLMKEIKAGIVTDYSETVDVNELPSGIYVLKVSLNDDVLNYRLVVNK